MNKDLMMQVAIQSKGVWPDQEETHLYELTTGNFTIRSELHGCSDLLICTREEFEIFVDSLFEGAPDDATHRGVDGLFYKLGATSAYFLNCGTNDWRQDANGKYWQSKNLIPRPAKKAEPEAPWVPKVGEECEWLQGSDHKWTKAKILADIGDNEVVIYSDGEKAIVKNPSNFRPLRTERELFIEQAITSYLDKVGSDVINERRLGRIFGALFDKGARFDKN